MWAARRRTIACLSKPFCSGLPAPFHAIPLAWAGPSLLAMIVFEKFGDHLPLNRQAERYALEGAPIALSTMADAVGAIATALDPLRQLVEAQVMAAERLHGDDEPTKLRPTMMSIVGWKIRPHRCSQKFACAATKASTGSKWRYGATVEGKSLARSRPCPRGSIAVQRALSQTLADRARRSSRPRHFRARA